MMYCNRKIGESYFRTPRSTVKAFVNMLSILEQNPGTTWQSLLETVSIAPDTPDDAAEAGANGEGDELTSIRLS